MIAGKRADPRRRAQKDAKKQPQPQDGPHVGESEEGRVGETRGGVWDGERARGRRDWAVIRKNARSTSSACHHYISSYRLAHFSQPGRRARGCGGLHAMLSARAGAYRAVPIVQPPLASPTRAHADGAAAKIPQCIFKQATSPLTPSKHHPRPRALPRMRSTSRAQPAAPTVVSYKLHAQRRCPVEVPSEGAQALHLGICCACHLD